MTIACDSYTKKEVTDKFSDLIGNAPVLLNTLQEIATIIGDPSNITTNLIATIANKANENEVFIKSTIDNDMYLALGNKRFASLGTNNNILIFEIKDNFGNTITDYYYSALTLESDPITKQISCKSPILCL